MSQAIHNDIAVQSESDLPPPRERKKALRSVSPPLSNVPFSRFNYALVILAAAVLAFYAWRLMQWKTEMGGWWNLALGRKPPVMQETAQNVWSGLDCDASGWSRKDPQPSVDQSIEELALALGIPSKDLAIAIAGAVKEHVPPASLSSIAAHETG